MSPTTSLNSFTQKNVCLKDNTLRYPVTRCLLGEWNEKINAVTWGGGRVQTLNSASHTRQIQWIFVNFVPLCIAVPCFELYKASHLESSLIFVNLCSIVWNWLCLFVL